MFGKCNLVLVSATAHVCGRPLEHTLQRVEKITVVHFMISHIIFIYLNTYSPIIIIFITYYLLLLHLCLAGY